MPEYVQREVTLRGLLQKCKKKKNVENPPKKPTIVACRTILPVLIDFKRHVYSLNVEDFCYLKKQTWDIFGRNTSHLYTVMRLPGKS